MDGTTIIFLMFIFWLFVIFVISCISNGKPLPKNSDGTTPYKVKLTYISGLDNLIGQYKCIMSNLDNILLINIKSNNLKIELPYNKIISIGNKIKSHQEIDIQTKTKSPIAHGLIGGAIAGTAGAIIGGMSGVNSKTEGETYTVDEDYLIINYKTSDNKEKELIFHIENGNNFDDKRLIKYVNKKIGNEIENTTIKI